MKMKSPIFPLFLITLLGFSCQQGPSNETLSNSDENIEENMDISYQEVYRPQFHFSPPTMWMNDPNGMFYHEGEYHLFYQHYPEDKVWGPMHWGHAISKDLVHWENLPIALYPDELGYIFSGCAVVDRQNSSGFGTVDNPPIVALFTYHDPKGEKAEKNDFQTQGIAYSTDKGRSWTKYDGNPVIANPGIRDFRDPKVFWHAETEKWVMILASGDRVRLYNSGDLKEWTAISEFGVDQGSHGGVWECPDLFELPVEGTNDSKWVMIVSLTSGGPNRGSGTMYFIGDFDGQNFTNSNTSDEVLWLDYGRDNYAGVTWSDIPEQDGRRLFIGWMSNWMYANQVPTDPWRSTMTLVRSLHLKNTSAGVRLISRPIAAQEKIVKSVTEIPDIKMESSGNMSAILSDGLAQGKRAQLTFDITNTTAARVGLALSNVGGEELVVYYDIAAQQFIIDRNKAGQYEFSEDYPGLQRAPRITSDNKLVMDIWIDQSSIELFADGGEVVMTSLFFPRNPYTLFNILVDGGAVGLESSSLATVERIW